MATDIQISTPQPTTTVVNISSAQILSMGTSPIELLPSPGINKYYDIEKVVLEYTHVLTPYTLPDPYLVINQKLAQMESNLITDAENGVILIKPSSYELNIEDVFSYFSKIIINSSLVLTTINTTNPTLGDGTIRAIITYTVRTFGA